MKSHAIDALPIKSRRSLRKFGDDLAIARKKRRMSTISMAERAFISRSTLARVEQGDPTVSIGAYASVLAVLAIPKGFGDIADSSEDALGMALEEHRLPKRIATRRGNTNWP